MQFNANAANAIDRKGRLTPKAVSHIQDLYDFVMKATFDGKQIFFHCNQGQFRSVCAAAACLKSQILEPYPFLNKQTSPHRPHRLAISIRPRSRTSTAKQSTVGARDWRGAALSPREPCREIRHVCLAIAQVGRGLFRMCSTDIAGSHVRGGCAPSIVSQHLSTDPRT